MKTGYGFTEFESLKEFKTWLDKQVVTRKINKLQVHHMGAPSYACWPTDNALRRQYNTKYFHMKNHGWGNIAQHFSICPNGHIVTGRSLNSTPIGIKGWNTGAICIEIYGNFDKGVDTMYVEQALSVLGVYKLLAERFKVSISAIGIRPHCWFTKGGSYVGDFNPSKAAKTCPGTGFFGGNTKESFNKNFYPFIKAFNTTTLQLEGKVLSGPSCNGGSAVAGNKPVIEDYTNYREYVAPRVKELQQKLTTLGYYKGKIDENLYNKELYTAVTSFQKDLKLDIDGWVGSKTWEAIETALADKESHDNPNPNDIKKANTQEKRLIKFQEYLEPRIKECKLKLYRLGYLPGEIDDTYGPKMYSAVTRFQRSHKLKADGYVGDETWEAIEKEYPSVPTSYTKLAKVAGKRTIELQEKLKSLGYYFDKVDGNFGPNTYSAVICFQRDKRLDVDGSAGPKTWAAIERAINKAL